MNSIIQNLDPAIAQAMGWTIIHSFWQASLIALIMSIVHNCRNRASSNFKYRVATVSMIAVFVVSSITFSLYYNSFTGQEVTLASTELASMQLTLDTESTLLGEIQLFFNKYLKHINLIWAFGVILFFVRFIFSYAYTKYLKGTAIFSQSTGLEQVLERIKTKLDIDKYIDIAESSNIDVPLVVGHMKPLILFPIGIVNMLTSAEVEAIITHELAHIKRYDYLTNLLLTVIEILFYFHPAVWWISANVKAERENCCDDFALSQNIDKIVYAKALVKLEEIKTNRTPALAMPFSSKKHQLLNRIKRIMNMPQTQNDIKEKSIATILLLSIVLLFSNTANSEIIDVKPIDTFIEYVDTTIIKGDDEMILKVKEGKLESLTIDNEIQQGDALDKVASTMNEAATDKTSYTVTVKDRPRLEIIDNKVNIKGQGGIVYESDDESVSEINRDTIPRNWNENSKIVTQNNGRVVEIEKKDGEVVELKVDGEIIPKSEYGNYEKEIESVNEIYKFDGDSFFKDLDEDFSKSFGMIFDGENWREFGGNMNQFFDEDILEKLKGMEHMRFNFEGLENLEGLERLEKLEGLENLEGLERLQELRGLEGLEELEGLSEMLEEMGISLDSNFSGMNFNFDNFDGFEGLQFLDDDNITIYRGEGADNESGTVVDKIGSMLNKDGLLKEYKANKVEITGKHLKINGEKMPKALFEKYKNIYQETTGAPLTKNSKMIFDVEGKPSTRKVRTF